ncbi:MAG: ergothioneine biosynthesis protein EgtB [Bacteroidota bacterium]
MLVSTQLKDAFLSVRQQTMRLCEPLQPEDYVVQPIADVSPPKWHLGHTTWFFETFVLPHSPGYRVFSPEYNYLFNSYYESVGARVVRTDRGNMTRPAVKDIYAYRAYVDEAIMAFLESDTSDTKEVRNLIELGLQHEQQHQELLVTDMQYILGNNPLFPVYAPKSNQATIPFAVAKENYVDIKSGLYSIGYDGTGFCFDNERGVHQVYLHPFRVSDRLVTNGEYLEFMEDGGYTLFVHWLQEGWEWVKQGAIRSPLYWHKINDQWCHYTLHGLEKITPAAPVTHVSFYEAEAFARWKGKRLLTEFEWEAACMQLNAAKPLTGNFVEANHLHPRPCPQGANQFFGDAWEWTNSAYLPYPYYQKAEGALGEYNGKFMINQMVLRGGSCATPQSHIRATYRNFFHPDKRWQFTGIRLAQYS